MTERQDTLNFKEEYIESKQMVESHMEICGQLKMWLGDFHTDIYICFSAYWHTGWSFSYKVYLLWQLLVYLVQIKQVNNADIIYT